MLIILKIPLNIMFIKKQEFEWNTEDRQFLDYLPPISILLGGLVFIVGTLTAIFLYQTPNGKYQFLSQYFSELGVRHDYYADVNGSTVLRYAPPHPDIFNISLFAAGFLLIPFFLFSYRQMRNNNRVSNFFLFLSIIGGMLAGIMLIGVGIFDLSYPAKYIWQEHGFWVAWLYLLIGLISIFWYIMIITSHNLPYRVKTRWIWLDYAFLAILIFLAIVNIGDGVNLFKVINIPILNHFPVETYQKLLAYVFFMYYGFVVGGRLANTKYDNTPVKPKTNNKIVVDAIPEPVSPQLKETESEPVGKIFCTSCGLPNPVGTKYCTECGAKLE